MKEAKDTEREMAGVAGAISEVNAQAKKRGGLNLTDEALALAVRAVNNFDRMLFALTGALDNLRRDSAGMEAWEVVNAAIEKARE